MRLVVLSDIHGNDVAFKNCLNYISRVNADHLFFLGDAIGYMPNGTEVIDLLIQHGFRCIMGNHDAMGLGIIEVNEKNEKIYNLNEGVSRLSEKQLKVLANFPLSIEERFDGKLFHMVHGSPRKPLTEYVYQDSDLSQFENMEADVFLVGHTHRPFVRNIGDKVIINVGSIGLPRDIGNLSSLVVIETLPFSVELIRIPFLANKVISEAQGDIHSSVKDCFMRTAETFIGRKVVNNK